MEQYLNKLGEEQEEKIYERILIENIIEMRKRLDYEWYTQKYGPMKRILADLDAKLIELETARKKETFYELRRLVQTRELVSKLESVIVGQDKHVFSNEFKQYCRSFVKDIDIYMDARKRKFKLEK